MAIVSYAQNFEDVILWRALKHVERGFYIDIGALHPVHDSVSLAFHQNGWRGVHVEPLAYYAEELRRARPGDDVLEVAVAAEEGTIEFFSIPESGLSTGDKDIARGHEQAGYLVEQIRVPCTPLSAILRRYGDQDIHWLKIDVEGMEKAVVESWQPSSVRPWIVVVEATKPMLAEPAFSSWEETLFSYGYQFVYFDGLNRFYLSDQHLDLRDKFGAGPNIFDDFVLADTVSFCGGVLGEKAAVEQRLAALKVELVAQRRLAAEQQRRLAAEHEQNAAMLQDALAFAQQQLADIHASSAWRTLGALRRLARKTRWIEKAIRTARKAVFRSRNLATSSLLPAALSSDREVDLHAEPEGVRHMYARLMVKRSQNHSSDDPQRPQQAADNEAFACISARRCEIDVKKNEDAFTA
jgi:FkbM family methyltransferase